MRLRALETKSGTVLVFDLVTPEQIGGITDTDFSAMTERGFSVLGFQGDVDLTDDRG